MSGLFFALLATFLASIGARDQMLVAQITQRQGPRPMLLLIAVVACLATSAAAAWLAIMLAAEVPGTPARLVFTGIALGLAGGEALLLGARRAPEEPTQSLFAALLVIAAHQLTDAARFIVLALALVTAAPIPVALGGAAGSVVALGLAWTAPEIASRSELPRLRRLAGLFLLAAGLVLAWRGIS